MTKNPQKHQNNYQTGYTVDGQSFAGFIKAHRNFFTKATRQCTDSYLFTSVMMAYPDSTAMFSFLTPDKQKLSLRVNFENYHSAILYGRPEANARYSGDIQYVNIGLISEEEIEELMPELARAQGIIFDLHDYPNIWIRFTEHLLQEKDKLETMYTKCYLYPGRELPRTD
ncbi:MAG TPA: hypothetical protein P5533_00780 [Candidatus Cloacimonadota bacterium]|nr:hypothetical protein [Candidatus Cloacimonadota bacterium]